MTRDEVIDLLEEIDSIYPGRFRPADLGKTIETWHKALKDYPAHHVKENLIIHTEESEYVPTIANLLRKPPVSRHVPSVEDTRKFLDKYENREAADPKVVEEAKAEIRKILGIGGERNG